MSSSTTRALTAKTTRSSRVPRADSSVPAVSRRGRITRGVAAAVAISAGIAAFPLRADEPPQIREIRIESENVFEDAETSVLARLADAIHGVTRPEVIRRELLFSEGDTLDPEKLAETERNLRALDLFRSVKIRVEPVASNLVDVVVHTRDGWTTQLSGSLGRSGGRNKFRAEIQENNLLGFGKSMSVSFSSNPDRDTRAIAYEDPQFLGRRLTLDVLYASMSDGERRKFALTRPFRSLETTSGGAAIYEELRQSTRIYGGGSEIAQFESDTRFLELSAGKRILADSIRPIARLTAGYRREEARFAYEEGLEDALPDERRFGFFFGRLDLLDPRFVVEQGIYSFSRDEDFDVGSRLSFELGYSPRLLGAEERFLGRMLLARGLSFQSGFLIGSLSARTRALPGGSLEHSIVEGTLLAVWRPVENVPQTVVARAQLSLGDDLDRDVQLTADGANGLRGYRLHAFTGNRRLLVNVEDRIRLTRELVHLFEIGAAAFVDVGYAWPEGSPLRLSDLRADAGIGLRIALPRAPSLGLFRLDVAYAMRPDLQGRRGWLLSFSSSQAF
jgi:Surface antigen variable number repeat/Omp85 superfamily domain